MVGLSYGAGNVQSYTRRMMQNCLPSYHTIKTLAFSHLAFLPKKSPVADDGEAPREIIVLTMYLSRL